MVNREERRTMQRAEGPGTEGRGALIVFEGLDRCGKSTQCELLLERLPEGTATLVKFPDRETATGKLIDAYLAEGQQIHDRAIHLLFSANRWEKRDMLVETLSSGVSVVCDRYSFSGLAFSVAKGNPLEWCRQCDAGLPSPDLVLYLDSSPEAAAQRASFGVERYERGDFQTRVGNVFAELREQEAARGAPWKVINADRCVEDVRRDVHEAVDACIQECSTKGKDLTFLWGGHDHPPASPE